MRRLKMKTSWKTKTIKITNEQMKKKKQQKKKKTDKKNEIQMRYKTK